MCLLSPYSLLQAPFLDDNILDQLCFSDELWAELPEANQSELCICRLIPGRKGVGGPVSSAGCRNAIKT